MSWRQESAALARELAPLALTGSSAWLPPAGLQEAVQARREVLFLLRRVLSDVRAAPEQPAGSRTAPARQWSLTESTVGELRADPVAALERGLREYPAPRGRSTGAAADTPGAAAEWPAVGRRTALATLAWSQVVPAELTAAERWSVVADVAALAEVVTVLDEDLLAAARLPYRGDPALLRSLESATSQGLALAARESAALAAAGDLPDWDEPGRNAAPRRIMVVGSLLDLPAAQERLVAQLQPPAALSPQSVIQVAAGQARILRATATALLHGERDIARAVWARHLSGLVADGLGAGHQLAAAPGQYSTAPATQTGEMLRCLRSRAGDPADLAGADWGALGAATDRVPQVLQVLARRAEEAWRSGLWLVPDPDPRHQQGEQRWIPADRVDAEPALCAGLSATAARAITGTGARPAPARTGRSGPTPPRELLPAVTRGRRLRRPLLPSQRPPGPAQRD